MKGSTGQSQQVSISEGARAFQSAFAEARALRSARLDDDREQKKRRSARKRRVMPEGLSEADQRTWRLKENLRIEDARKFAENARFDASLVEERLRDGFRMCHARKVYGRWRKDVREKGPLRSEAFGLPGQMFVASCRKGGDLRMSWDKAYIGVESRSKLLSLDLPYYEANKTFLSFWRIDLDGTWPSVDAFAHDVLDLVGRKIPFAPHLIAGDQLPDGRFHNPHVIIFLPPGEAVWNDPENPKCNMRIVKFFEAVYYGIVDALKELGADPGAPATTQRGKNPLSPLSTAFVMNDSRFMSMSDWEGWVDTSLNREALVRQRAADKTGVTIEASNGIFTAVQMEAYRILRQWHFDSDPRLRAPEGTVADNLHQALEPFAQETVTGLPGRRRMLEKQVTLLVSRVASYAAGAFDPARLEKGVVRKALMHVVDGLKTVRERQQVAAEYASKEKAEKTLARLVEAWDTLAVGSADVSKSALAREAGVSRPTVYARWAELQAVLDARKGCKVRCIDKRLPIIPAMFDEQKEALHGMAAETCPAQIETSNLTAAEVERSSRTRSTNTAKRDVQAAPVVAVRQSEPSSEIWDPMPWHENGHDDDWAEIATQEAFLARDRPSPPEWNEPEPPPGS